MNIVSKLNNELLKQPFTEEQDEPALLTEYQQIAYGYTRTENAIAVLSDLRAERSYIYNGGFANRLGFTEQGSSKEIHSIWEEEILNRIHPDDLIRKHLFELQFFYRLKSLPLNDRSNYHVISKMRMADKSGAYIPVQHRMFYVYHASSGNLWLALCLYNYSFEQLLPEVFDGKIVNTITGEIIKTDKEKCNNILSRREKEVLHLIEKGKASKEIAGVLSISKNTVDRHRQNILEKLRVKNSFEACRVAKLMDLI